MELRFVEREVVVSDARQIVKVVKVLQQNVLLHTYMYGEDHREWIDVPTITAKQAGE